MYVNFDFQEDLFKHKSHQLSLRQRAKDVFLQKKKKIPNDNIVNFGKTMYFIKLYLLEKIKQRHIVQKELSTSSYWDVT